MSSFPEPFNLAQYVLKTGKSQPDKTALEVLDASGVQARWSYQEVLAAVETTAGGLRAMGAVPGDFILLRLGHTADFPILYLAAIHAGCIPVASSISLTAREVQVQMEALGGRGWVISETAPKLPKGWWHLTLSQARDLQSHAPIQAHGSKADDLAYIVFTSGTGSTPKAVAHAHRAVLARRMMWQDWYGFSASDRVLHAGAFNWTYTLGTGLMDPWAVGATALIYAGQPDREIWPRLAQMHKPTIFAAAPGVYRQMLGSLDLNVGFASLRHALSAGETLPQTVRDKWCAAAGKPIYEALGMSEISTFISSSPTTPHKDGTAGKPQTGRRVAVLDEATFAELAPNVPGHLAVHKSDPGLMLGYHREDELTQAQYQGNWFVTGDRAVMDDDGYITHLGRSDDVLNAGGFRVSPLEIEAVVTQDPDISECAAVELPVKADASVITVFFVASPRAPDLDRLREFCQRNLASYKCPRAFREVEALPRNANGKLRRRSLVETYGWKPSP